MAHVKGDSWRMSQVRKTHPWYAETGRITADADD